MGNYRKTIGENRLFKYSAQNLQKAIAAYRQQKGTLRSIATKYGVPKSTLERNVKKHNLKRHGGQTALSKAEEDMLVEALTKCATWGFPLRVGDLSTLVKSYSDRRGSVEKRFKDNLPGRQWVKRFLKAHPHITLRMSENIKRCRAEVDASVINAYFDNLEESLQNVPPENIINCDETNFTDDPKNERVIVRRGCKHPERVMDSIKTSTSVMFSVSGNGTLLPVYVVYKSTHLYPGWMAGGQEGAVYGCSESGWFDMHLFENYFEKICMPYFKSKAGKKAIVCDNLASHVSMRVLELCGKHDISFILLPPNSTHLTQPLDVAVFRGLKSSWRKELYEWKKKNRGVLPKPLFPKLLLRAIEGCSGSMRENIISGFRCCGIVPVNRKPVLDKIPKRDSTDTQDSDGETEKSWQSVLEDHLEGLRTQEKPKIVRGKKIQVPAGKGVTVEDLVSQCSASSSKNAGKKSATKKSGSKATGESDELSSDEDDLPVVSTSRSQNRPGLIGSPKKPAKMDLHEKDFVITKFTTETDNRERLFLGKIVNIDGEGFEISFMRKKRHSEKPDLCVPQCARCRDSELQCYSLKG